MITKESYEEAQKIVWDYKDQIKSQLSESSDSLKYGELIPANGDNICTGCNWEHYPQGCEACTYCIFNISGDFHFRKKD